MPAFWMPDGRPEVPEGDTDDGVPALPEPDREERGVRDPRGTSLPLFLLGAAITIPAVPELIWPNSLWIFGDWVAGALLTIALTVTWLAFRRRAARRGSGGPAGFGIAAVIGTILSLTPAVIVVFAAGPFVIFGLSLLAAGSRQDNRFLVGWAAVVGTTGVLAGVLGTYASLTYPFWVWWERPAIFLALGGLTVLAGLIMRQRENPA